MQYAAADGLPSSIADSVAGDDVVAVKRRGTVIGYYIPVQRPGQPESNTAPLEPVDTVRSSGDEMSSTAGLTFEDPLWRIVGIGRSDGPTDVAANIHRYLAEASDARRT